MKRKPFEVAEFRLADAAAREAAIRYFAQNHGVEFIENPDRYGIDLLGDTYGCECEIKKNWDTWEWPAVWKNIHIAERKGRYRFERALFFVVNKPLTRAAIFRTSVLNESPLTEIANCKVGAGERFYCVPMHLVTLVSL